MKKKEVKMAKRFTDTEKWKDDWYLSLSNDYKIVWQWLLDNCNHAGICKPSIKLLNMMCNVSITDEELIEVMDGRVMRINNIWFIPKFIKFQYGNLSSKKPAVVSVVSELIKNNLIHLVEELLNNDSITIEESLHNDSVIIKDKDKDKVKDKDIILPFDSEVFKSKWNEWIDYKKNQHKFVYKTESSLTIALENLNKLSNFNEQNAIQIINQSIANGWKGFFKLQNQNNETTKSRTATTNESLDYIKKRGQELYESLKRRTEHN